MLYGIFFWMHIYDIYVLQFIDAALNKVHPGGNARIFAYSDVNIKAVYDDRGIGPNYTYDDRGSVATITDTDGVKTSYKYYELNRVVETVSADDAKKRIALNKYLPITEVQLLTLDEHYLELMDALILFKIILYRYLVQSDWR